MNLSIYTDIEVLERERACWDQVAGDRAFCRYAWLMNWYEAMHAESDQIHVLVAIDDQEQWVGVAPLFVSGGKLRLLGSGNACTDYAGPFSSLEPELHKKFIELVSDYLADSIRVGGPLEDVDSIELEGCAKLCESADYLGELLSAHGFAHHETETEGTWKVLLPDSFDQLNATFSKSMRRKTKVARKRLAADDARVEFADQDSFDNHWNQFEALHQKRRKSLGQPGCFADGNFAVFLKTATRELLAASLAELLVIYKNDCPISSVLLLKSDNTCMMYQSGLDPDFSSYEPGYQTNLAGIEHAIKNGYKYFDFLRGDESYKARWSTTREPILRRKYVPRKLTAQLKHGTWVIGRSIKNYMNGLGQFGEALE